MLIKNVAPSVSGTLAAQTVQYSDPVAPVAITATDVAPDVPSLSISTTYSSDGVAWQAGLLSGLTLAVGSAAGTWTLAGKAMVPPGSYTVRAAVTDGFDTGTAHVTIDVTREDARATYTGVLYAATSSIRTSTAAVTLSATIQDVTAVDEIGYPNEGDIRYATVRFVDRDRSSATLCSAPVGLVDLTDTKTGTATCSWNAELGEARSHILRGARLRCSAAVVRGKTRGGRLAGCRELAGTNAPTRGGARARSG